MSILLVGWCGVFCLDALPVCAQTHSVLPLCFHFAPFDCQLFLLNYLSIKDNNFCLFFPFSPFYSYFQNSQNFFPIARRCRRIYKQRRWRILLKAIVFKALRFHLINLYCKCLSVCARVRVKNEMLKVNKNETMCCREHKNNGLTADLIWHLWKHKKYQPRCVCLFEMQINGCNGECVLLLV